jgi:Flp pilus assembly protein TadD
MFARGLLLPVAVVALVLAAGAARGEESAAQKVYDKVWPFIVVVRATDNNGNEAHGSGVIIGDNEVATNCHVVADANRIVVLRAANKGGAADDDETIAAHVSRGDYGRDICLLSVPDLQKNAKAAAIRKSKTLKVGEAVFAVGSPQGLDYSISAGIISQLRSLAGTPPLIQTDAAISQGSSGGGLFDADGNLVGLTTFYNREGQNLNFAVPTEWIADIRKKPAGEIAGADEKAGAKAGLDFWDKTIELETAEYWQGMLAHCRRWTEAEPQNATAWFGLGVAYRNLSRDDDAIAAYREALRINPEYANAWNNLGVAYYKLGRNDDAIAAYREALRIDPEYVLAWNNLGVTYGILGRKDDAIAAYREALWVDPEDAVAWYNLGVAYYKLGRNDDAIAAYREALRINPQYANAWAVLSIVYRAQGRNAEADEAHQKHLRLKVLSGE